MSERKCGDVDWLWTLLPWAGFGTAVGFTVNAVDSHHYGTAAFFGIFAGLFAYILIGMRGVARHCSKPEE